ncbi:GNAT family N-acetyltransferase [Neomicrococcus aestuarii]|jgi:uncharacterized protein|uniref:N-acetyltransferase domain-containing protein n=1 Tax=Neomicrococcus aestuarii TaxID=556325 RepID=A0A1L2ZNN0_9MICC|nr:GNAT family N-acetyltransferase [Neomicrococcus aestuarii]APF41035.1 hypothetical protein BHE16_08530 [Neomicrococcus aestuarii]
MSDDQFSVHFADHPSRFELRDGDKAIGEARFKDVEVDGQAQRIFYHTVVSEEYGGQGLAGRLAAYALQRTEAENRVVVPVCPYIKAYVAKHPEYQANSTAAQPRHLELLNSGGK